MDPLQRGFTLVEFEEEADPRSPLRCLRPITAALLAGYQLSPTDGGRAANMEHVFHVPRHPRNLPAMKRNQIRRTIAFRFRQAVLSTIAGEALRVEEFIAALESDARLRAAFSARADWDKSLAIMDGKIRAVPLAVRSGWDDRRFVIVPIRSAPADEPVRKIILGKYDA